MTERRNPFVFVVGCPRSGTTLLQRILDHHPALAVANDTHFIPKPIGGDGGDRPLTPELVDRVLAYHRFPRLGLREEDVRRAAAEAETYAGFVAALYTAFAGARGKPLGGEKTPDYVRHLPLLHRLFPWATVVHILRDGRDVALSALGWAREHKGPGRFDLWRQEPVAVCALWWGWQVAAGRQDHGDPRYMEVRYEDLVAEPRATTEAVCRHIGLPFAEEMLAYHEGRRRDRPGLSAKKAWLPPTRGLRDWRREMSEGDQELFEALAGDVLTACGYERRFPAISPAVAAVAERCRAAWGGEMARRRARQVARR